MNDELSKKKRVRERVANLRTSHKEAGVELLKTGAGYAFAAGAAYLKARAQEHTLAKHARIPIRLESNINVAWPGIYVYSYPSYLTSPRLDGRRLYKVGMSETNVGKRVMQQKRSTEVPEDLKLVRAFPSDALRSLEKTLHQALKAQRQNSSRGGREWFWTNTEEIESILRGAGYAGPVYFA